MPIILEEYQQIVSALAPVLDNLSGKLIAIDGYFLSGKTTLGRYLAWHFNISLVETDLFQVPPEQGNELGYDEEVIKRAIHSRINSKYPAPVIVEGATVQKLLKNIGFVPDYSIYIIKENEDDDVFGEIVRAYEEEYRPKENSNLAIELTFD